MFLRFVWVFGYCRQVAVGRVNVGRRLAAVHIERVVVDARWCSVNRCVRDVGKYIIEKFIMRSFNLNSFKKFNRWYWEKNIFFWIKFNFQFFLFFFIKWKKGRMRNGKREKPQVNICKKDGTCPVHHNIKPMCSGCRMSKCVAVGLK